MALKPSLLPLELTLPVLFIIGCDDIIVVGLACIDCLVRMKQSKHLSEFFVELNRCTGTVVADVLYSMCWVIRDSTGTCTWYKYV